ncbi:hypothetical protein ASF55_16120 [Methylobacterium sp. Leaf119]|nr:hypothetical protein ASF55_16120 [Methylobacterium sp. Leaf119]
MRGYMQRFYFNLRTPQGREVDRKGRNLRSAEEAFLEAYWAAPLLAMEVVSQGGDLNHYTFEVMNEMGQLVWDLSFHEALGRIFRLRRPDPPALG